MTTTLPISQNQSKPITKLSASQNLKDAKNRQIRLGLQGFSGSGKTYSALTAPNPVVIDLDNGLVAHIGRDIEVLPFHDYNWITHEYAKMPNGGGRFRSAKEQWQPDRCEATLHFLRTEASQMTEEQTLVFDTLSGFESAVTQKLQTMSFMTKNNKENDYAPWAKRIELYEELFTILKGLRCHVIMGVHETQIRDKDTGRLLDKLAPSVQGGYVTKLKSHFTDWVRCVKDPIYDENKKQVIGETYRWQVRSDNLFEAKTRIEWPRGIVNIEPNFNTLLQKYGLQKAA